MTEQIPLNRALDYHAISFDYSSFDDGFAHGISPQFSWMYSIPHQPSFTMPQCLMPGCAPQTIQYSLRPTSPPPNNQQHSPIQKAHSTSSINNTSSRRKFTEEEDKFLTELVKEMGPKKWEEIAKRMPNRTARQCRDRYSNYLIPGFFNGEWSSEEDELLYQKYQEIGPRWAVLKEFFKNRSPNSIKNRWNYFVSRPDFKDTIRKKVNIETKDEDLENVDYFNDYNSPPSQVLNDENNSFVFVQAIAPTPCNLNNAQMAQIGHCHSQSNFFSGFETSPPLESHQSPQNIPSNQISKQPMIEDEKKQSETIFNIDFEEDISNLQDSGFENCFDLDDPELVAFYSA